MRQINKAGRALIKKFEGLRLEAYRCPAGVWTIGVGCTTNVKPGMVITEAEAEARLTMDLSRFEADVGRLVTAPLTDNQFAALVAFAFNVGMGNFASSTLRKKLNAGDYKGAADELPRWNKAAGKVLPGLVKRREAERELFLSDSLVEV